MSLRRDKITIIFDILNAIQAKGGKIKPTHLLYKSNLSHGRMKQYVDELMSKGLLEEKDNKDKKLYILTDEGYKFISDYANVKKFMDSFGF